MNQWYKLFFIFFLVSFLPAADAFPEASPLPVIIDTDMGIDDAQAIIYLLNQPHLPILAITIEPYGEATCAAALEHINSLLQFTHRENIPFNCAHVSPKPDYQFPLEWRELANNFLTSVLPPSSVRHTYDPAEDLIFHALATASTQVNILVLGPSSGLAQAYLKNPDLFRKKVHAMYFTGGRYGEKSMRISDYLPQTKNNTSSWNFFIDPAAVKVLLHSRIPVYLNTGNNSLRFSGKNILKKLSFNQASLSESLVYKILNLSHNMFIGDQYTAVWMMYPEICQPKIISTEILLSPVSVAGTTVASPQGVPVYACLTGNEKAFDDIFVRGLKRVTGLEISRNT